MKGCWFHYIQTLRKKASKIKNFMTTIRKDKQGYKLFNKFFVLPLLKPALMENACDVLCSEASKFSHFDAFLNYFKKQWISKDPSKQFSLYKINMRTTSMLEAYNKKLGGVLPKHGNFFKFCSALLDEEFSSTVDFCSVMDGETWQIFERPKSKFSRRDEFIHEITKKIGQRKGFHNRIYQPVNVQAVCRTKNRDKFGIRYINHQIVKKTKYTRNNNSRNKLSLLALFVLIIHAVYFCSHATIAKCALTVFQNCVTMLHRITMNFCVPFVVILFKTLAMFICSVISFCS